LAVFLRDHHRTCECWIVLNFLQQNQLGTLISEIYFWNKSLHVSDSSSARHQAFFIVHTAIGICHTGYADRLRAGSGRNSVWSCSQAVSKLVWRSPLLCLQWKSPDDGRRNCPKHVEFYSKNKFEKLVHLVCFIMTFITMHGHLNVKFAELLFMDICLCFRFVWKVRQHYEQIINMAWDLNF